MYLITYVFKGDAEIITTANELKTNGHGKEYRENGQAYQTTSW